MNKILPFQNFISFTIALTVSSVAWTQATPQKATDFSGEFTLKQDHFLTSENRTVKDVVNTLKINAINDSEAQILVETFTQNMHRCDLVGKAKFEKGHLVFKSQISPQLNRGKKGQCVLKISKNQGADGTAILKVDDTDGMCRLQFCGFQAELTGEFRSKPPVEVKDKN
ncbi:MAG: hypothetical protein ACK5V3_15000 [Bdellovibrionales bacterium]